jgi:hypothetical protein
VIDQYGRARRYKTRHRVTNVVVTAASPADLNRAPDYQMMNKGIDIYSPRFRFRGPVRDPVSGATTTHPDEVEWHGSLFVVDSFSDFSNYGRGYTYVHCISLDAVDGQPIPTERIHQPAMGSAD